MQRQFMKKIVKIPKMIYFALSYAYDEYLGDKRKKYTPEQFASFGEDSFIYPKVTITHPNRVVIGKGCTIQKYANIASMGGVHIGDYVNIGYDSVIISFTHNYAVPKSIPLDDVVSLKPVIIRDFVSITWRAVIMPGVEIGEGAVVSTGAVVTKNVPPHVIVSGNPAKVVGYRSKKKFEQCKKERSFTTHRILETYGKFDERIQPIIKKRYLKELKELGML